jgi:hypothetical protein
MINIIASKSDHIALKYLDNKYSLNFETLFKLRYQSLYQSFIKVINNDYLKSGNRRILFNTAYTDIISNGVDVLKNYLEKYNRYNIYDSFCYQNTTVLLFDLRYLNENFPYIYSHLDWFYKYANTLSIIIKNVEYALHSRRNYFYDFFTEGTIDDNLILTLINEIDYEELGGITISVFVFYLALMSKLNGKDKIILNTVGFFGLERINDKYLFDKVADKDYKYILQNKNIYEDMMKVIRENNIDNIDMMEVEY